MYMSIILFNMFISCYKNENIFFIIFIKTIFTSCLLCVFAHLGIFVQRNFKTLCIELFILGDISRFILLIIGVQKVCVILKVVQCNLVKHNILRFLWHYVRFPHLKKVRHSNPRHKSCTDCQNTGSPHALFQI